MKSSGARIALAMLSTLGLDACVTTLSTSAPGTDRLVARVSTATRAWVLTRGGEAVGSVIRFGARPRGFLFVVRNVHGQDTGMVDSLGRAWRFEPPAGRPVCIGSGTVASGAGRILGLGDGLVLRESATPSGSLSTMSSAPVLAPLETGPEPIPPTPSAP